MGDQQTGAVRRGYRGPFLSLAELLDELISEGRSRPQACVDVIRATEDGAIFWIDSHPNPRAPEEVVKSIIQIVQSYMNRRLTRVPIIPLPGSVDYVRALRVMRAQCQEVFGLSAPTVPINTEAEQPSRREAKKKDCPLSVYGRHFKDTMKVTGAAPTRKNDTDWAKDNQYGVKSALQSRRDFKANLSVEQKKLFKSGPRRAKSN
jgi:hypothetical protein